VEKAKLRIRIALVDERRFELASPELRIAEVRSNLAIEPLRWLPAMTAALEACEDRERGAQPLQTP
jgi:hypothetical protein